MTAGPTARLAARITAQDRQVAVVSRVQVRFEFARTGVMSALPPKADM
jgi:hypothetical protein